MLFERRSYTPRPGRLQPFIDAQIATGFPDSPISAQKVLYTTSLTGPTDQIVHFWAYEDLADWEARYAPLYANENVQRYLETVRPGFLRQEYAFFRAAPLASLTPHFRAERWWKAGDDPLADLVESPDLVVEMRTTSVRPGSLPDFWQACATHDIGEVASPGGQLIGFFGSVAGRQYEVMQLSWYADTRVLIEASRARAADTTWQAFEAAISPLVDDQQIQWLAPWTVPENAPLFHRRA